MSIKKYSSGSWVTVPYRKYETATDTITSLPKTIIGDGQPISAYTIKGNMTQSGTPTPSNPVYPVETGDKTANLYDYTKVAIGKYIDSNGVEQTSGSTGHQILNHSDYVPVTAGTMYVFKIQKEVGYSALSNAFCWFDSSKQLLYRDVRGEIAASEPYIEMTYTAPTNAAYLVINFRDTYYNTGMLNTGSTALPYEPFGYKIPISLSQNTYNIYITEPLRKSLDGSNVFDTIESNGTLTRRVDANGDALATPTTEQVTVPTLTTTGTAEQFNVLTTLAPSEVSLTYHGWHEHSDTKFTTP